MTTVRNALFACLLTAAAACAAVDPSLLNLVMPDAKIISGIQVDKSKASPFGKYVLSQMQTNDENFTKFVADTHFDPTRDLSELLIATAGTSDKPVFLVVGRGVFDTARILNTATASGATSSSYNGIPLLSESSSNMEAHAVAFLDGSTAAMGTLTAVKDAIDRRIAPKSLLPAAIAGRVTELSNTYDAWFLSTGPVTDFFAGKFADPNLNGAMQGNLLQAVKQASGGIRFGATAVQIEGQAVTRSTQDATALSDVVRFVAGLVQMNKDSNAEAQKVASLLDTMTLGVSGSAMNLSLSIPEDVVEKLFMPSGAKPASHLKTHKTASLR